MVKKVRGQDHGSTEGSLPKGVMKKGVPKKYNKMFVPEALETAKQKPTVLEQTYRRQENKPDILHQTIQSAQ